MGARPGTANLDASSPTVSRDAVLSTTCAAACMLLPHLGRDAHNVTYEELAGGHEVLCTRL